MKRIFTRIGKPLPILALGGALLLTGSVWGFEHKPATEGNGKTLNVPMDETAVPRSAGPYESFAPIVKKVAPAVVKVVVTASCAANLPDQQWPGFDDPFWRHFFGGPMMPQRQMPAPLEHGLGSGVIVTKDGYILTNNHVVDGAKDVQVTLQDGREFTAKVIGRDSKSDIAVIKIDADNLPTVRFADSQKVQVGDIVLAIGNPFGVGQTVTHGIVSATDRGGMGIEDYEDFIQTDAAINPGNSGGALVDADGRLIGINTAILSRSGGNQGIGFAIPSDLARSVMTSLVEYGHVTRGYLGVMIQDVTPSLAKEFNLKQNTGALVGDVLPNGPAEKSGLKDGDVVLEFNGKKVPTGRDLKLTVAETKPGSKVPVEIIRNGSTKTIDVTVGQLPGSQKLAQNNSRDTGTLQGVGVSDLNSQARQQFKIPETVHGAVVTQVQPNSAASQAGLKTGDVIESINRHPVKDAEQAVQLTENAKDKHTLLRVWSDGGSHYVVVDESQTG
ncbi:MAG TPA: DegQ family serine endoprotease [Verrucomicrobiae bacterium]|nr:DegQ family serine endoprotease [Verrucomicrobiae bacterium]